jgi:hypothetical protein
MPHPCDKARARAKLICFINLTYVVVFDKILFFHKILFQHGTSVRAHNRPRDSREIKTLMERNVAATL